ncbi:hypothetical protein RF11_14423 [Thelohanellus kitauei]|uniref:Uncharacterized protein n=1 Tax=Thelohanellus kitauei TaxID=669202 RepID=A0A0C2MU91_THEKT|nr:hypothetical protein RF11_14423 [Thelohanellus kitauei]
MEFPKVPYWICLLYNYNYVPEICFSGRECNSVSAQFRFLSPIELRALFRVLLDKEFSVINSCLSHLVVTNERSFNSLVRLTRGEIFFVIKYGPTANAMPEKS